MLFHNFSTSQRNQIVENPHKFETFVFYMGLTLVFALNSSAMNTFPIPKSAWVNQRATGDMTIAR